MNGPRRKTIELPDDDVKRDDEPDMLPFAFIARGAGRDLRDVTKPIAYDEQGRPLFAPRGIIFRFEP